MKATKKQAGKRSGRGGAAPKRAYDLAPQLTYRLRRFVGAKGKGYCDFGAVWGEAATKELRALLAVAHAAQQATVSHDYFAFDGAGHSQGDHVLPKDCRGCRLEASLRRLSRAGGER